MHPLPPAPASLVDVLEHEGSGLFAGRAVAAPADELPRPGRLRCWRYAAAAGDGGAIGAAIAHLGYVAAAFVWAWLGDELVTWEDRSLFGRAATTAAHASATSHWRRRGATVSLGDDGEMGIDVPTGRGRLIAQVEVGPGDPATLVTRTPRGGWNVTEKNAGYRAWGAVAFDRAEWTMDGWGWRDWTVGRQDPHTRWRWAAGAGRCEDRTVGINVSTGMNSSGTGEDVVWWDGSPTPLEVKDLVRNEDGRWSLRGPEWYLEFSPVAERAADERFGPFLSRYVQPVGWFEGTLPGPAGASTEVRFWGVTEEHEARW